MNKENKTDLILSVSIGVLVALLLFGVSWFNARKPLLSSNTSFSSENLILQKEINSLKNQDRQQTQPLKIDRSSEQTILRLLGDGFSGYSTFRDKSFTNALSEVGITLNYQNEPDQKKRAQLLVEGKADLVVTDLSQFLQHMTTEGKVVGLIDRSNGADAIVLAPEIKSLEDLKQLIAKLQKLGKRPKISYASNTPSEHLAEVLDDKFESFKLSEFEWQDVADARDAWTQLQDPHSGVKVAVLWEPYISIARQLGYNVVLSSRDIPAIVDVIVASKQAIESRPEMIHDFLGAYYRRVDLANQDSDLLISQIAQDARISLSDAQRIKEGINFFSSVEAQQWMNDGTLRKRIASTAALLVLNGKLQKRPENFSDLYEPKFVEEAVKNTQALIALVRADNPSLAERLAGSLQPSARQSTTQGFAGEAIGNLQLKGEIQFAINSASLTQTGEKRSLMSQKSFKSLTHKQLPFE
ncbi:MAG: hypothetical protein HC763_20560 [Hydrococcus sp. CRU_1_1]|nr:hypothetical protein [Hydrococcus sp. CRU_1_1]